MNNKIITDIHDFIDINLKDISCIRVCIGTTPKADTVAIFTIDEGYIPQGDHAGIEINAEDLHERICETCTDNGYGTFHNYLRIYAYKENGKQFATLQRTTKLNQEEPQQQSEQQIAPIVSPLINGIVKLLDQMMKANETLSNSLAHSQDAQLRLMDGILEAKEEGIDYQAIALQTQMILENMQAPPEEDNGIGDRLLEVLSMGMGGLGTGVPPHMQEPTPQQATEGMPNKETLKEWIRRDPSVVKMSVEAFQEVQQENNNPKTNNTSQGETKND